MANNPSFPVQPLLRIDSALNDKKNILQSVSYQPNYRFIMVQRILYDKILNIDKAVYFCDNYVFYTGCKS
jgi:hypothetical protein